MATETLALQVDVNTGKAVSNLGKLEKATKSVATTTKTAKKETITLEQQFKNLNKQIKEEPVNIRAMNKQIQEYQAIALQAGRTSPLGKQAIQKAAAIKDKYVDIQNEVNRLANDGVKLKAALDLGSTVVAGFAGFQGIMALSGSKSEDLRKAMMKLQGAMSLLMAVETIRKNLEKESTLVLIAKQTVEKAGLRLTKATTAAQTMLGRSTDATTKSFKLMRGALIATGIGALVILIGTLIAQWDNITAALSSTTAEQKALNETMEAASKAAEEVYVEINKVETAFKLAEDGVISKEEALNTYNETIGLTLGEAESLEEAEQKFKDGTADYVKMAMLRAQSQELIKMASEEQTKALLASTKDQRSWVDKTVGIMQTAVAGAVDYSTAGLTNLTDKSNTFNEFLKKGREEQVIDASNSQAAMYLNLNKSIEEQMALIEAKDSYISEKDKKDKKDKDKKEAKRLEKIAAARKKLGLTQVKNEKKAIYDLALAQQEAYAAEIINTKLKADELIKIEKFKLKEALKDKDLTASQIKLLEFKTQEAIDKIKEDFNKKDIDRRKVINKQINKEYNKLLSSIEALENAHFNRKTEDKKRNEEIEENAIRDKYFTQIELLKERGESTKLLEEAQKQDIAEINKKYREQEIKEDTEVQNAKLSMAQSSIGALMNLTTEFAKDNEKSQKRAFEINKKLQIAQALIGTYQGVQAIFTSAAMNPASVLFPAMPYIQAAIALASGLANVKNISKQQFQSSSPGGSGPTFSGSLGGGSVPTLNPVSNTNTVLGQENKVYVTETDISNTQNKVKVIEEQATF